MTSIAEFVPIVKALKGMYAQPTFMAGEEMIELWYKILQDFDYETVNQAVLIYISTKSQPPCPADIRKICIDILSPEELGEAEAWVMVRNAVSDGIYHSRERFAELPPEVQKAVGSAEQIRLWAAGEDFNESVISSNFKRNYRQVLERKNNDALIPLSVVNRINQIRLETQTKRMISG